MVDEERHYNQYDDEMGNMKKFGANYLALQSIERSKTRAQAVPTGPDLFFAAGCWQTRASLGKIVGFAVHAARQTPSISSLIAPWISSVSPLPCSRP